MNFNLVVTVEHELLNLCGNLILQIGDFLCFAGNNFAIVKDFFFFELGSFFAIFRVFFFFSSFYYTVISESITVTYGPSVAVPSNDMFL